MTIPSIPMASAAKVAAPLFNTGPNDTLAVVDAYTAQPATIINSLVGKLSAFDSSPLDAAGASGLIASLGAMFTSGKSPFSVNPADMQGRVSSLIGGGPGALGGMAASVVGSLTAGLGLNAQSAGALAVTIGSVQSKVNSNNPASVTSFMGLVNTVAGDAGLGSVLDVGAETSLLTGMIGQCISMGLPGAIPGIAANARSQPALTMALQNNVNPALNSGSLTAIGAILAQPTGRSIIASQAPNATQTLLGSYTLPAGTPPSSYPTQCTALTSILGAIDPNWNTYARNGSSVSNLGSFMGASPDALKVLSTDPAHSTAATIAGDFSGTYASSMKGTAQQMYPYAQFTGLGLAA